MILSHDSSEISLANNFASALPLGRQSFIPDPSALGPRIEESDQSGVTFISASLPLHKQFHYHMNAPSKKRWKDTESRQVASTTAQYPRGLKRCHACSTGRQAAV